MSEETPKTTIVTRIRDWVAAHPIISGVVVGSTIAVACSAIAARFSDAPALTAGEAAPLEIESDGVEE